MNLFMSRIQIFTITSASFFSLSLSVVSTVKGPRGTLNKNTIYEFASSLSLQFTLPLPGLRDLKKKI